MVSNWEPAHSLMEDAVSGAEIETAPGLPALTVTCLPLCLWGRRALYGSQLALPRRRQWHPTPVLLPGKSHGRRSMVGCSPWGPEGQARLSDFTFTFMHWRRKWQPTPVFLPGEFQGWWCLVGCSPWGSQRVRHD